MLGSCVTTVLNLGSWPYGCVLQTGQRTLVTHEPNVVCGSRVQGFPPWGLVRAPAVGAVVLS
jgi:hypothetical protein